MYIEVYKKLPYLFSNVKKDFLRPRCLRHLWLMGFPGIEVPFVVEIVEVE